MHALLSASGANRWLNCPPSARLEENVKEKESPYAAEGTAAHELAEIQLKKDLKMITHKAYQDRYKHLNQTGFMDQEMVDFIEDYKTAILERLNDGTKILLEERVDFSKYVKEGFGTSDVILIDDELIEVIDLKYGKGVPVSAENNPQMRLYALGALEMFEPLYDFKKVKYTIIQPRLDNTSSEELEVDSLKEWGEKQVKPIADMAFEGKGNFNAGDHCQFCKVKATCKARADKNLELAKYDFEDPKLLTLDQISDILSKATELKNWVTDIESYALDQAENHGVKLPGFKLVEGRSNRKISEAVIDTLKKAGYSDDEIFEKKMLGITKLEKLIGKKKLSDLAGDFISKPPGKPTLVPESDKRPEINSAEKAKQDFKKEEL